MQPKKIPSAWLEAMLSDKKVNNVNAAPGSFGEIGGRNCGLASLAGSMRRNGANPDQMEAVLQALNDTFPDPLPKSEVAGIARSVGKYEPGGGVASDDVGLSRQVAERLKGRFLVVGKKGWLSWTGTHWNASAGEMQAQEAVKCILEDFLALDPARGQSLCSNTRVKAMMGLTVSDEALQIGHGDVDASSDLLNLRNGTRELTDGTFRPHDPADRLTKLADVDYDPDATCPVFDAFLERIQPDAENRAFLLRLFGYALLGDPAEHRFVVFTGAGRNGKSTLVEAVRHVFGDYGMTVEPNTFLQQRGDKVRSDLARLRGARLVSTSETNHGERLDASLVKRLTGGEKITARALYGTEFEFKPQFVPIMSTNALPIVDGGDSALARRFVIVPFDTTIPEHEVDTRLPQKLLDEASGILNRLLEGLHDYQKQGLAIPADVENASRGFMERSDLIGTFLNECYTEDSKGRVSSADLYDDYRVWCLTDGLNPMSKRQFTEKVNRQWGDPGKSGGFRGYSGRMKLPAA